MCSSMTNQNETLRKFSTVWPAVFFCTSCLAVKVPAPRALCNTCINKVAEVARYDAYVAEKRRRLVIWSAIVVITAIVFTVTWYAVGR